MAGAAPLRARSRCDERIADVELSVRMSTSSGRTQAMNPLPTIILLTVAAILLVPLAALNLLGWILAPGVDVQRPPDVAHAAQLVYVLAWAVPFVGCVVASVVAFRRHRRKQDPLLVGVGALVLVLVGWAVSLVVPPLLVA